MSIDFAHLHLHTEYSLLDGVQKIRPIFDKIKANGMTACAITDHGSMAGVYEFWSTAREYNIKPIIGCEVYVASRKRTDKDVTLDKKRYHLTLLAQNKTGYHNLLKLISLANIEGFYYKPRVDVELLKKYNEGIIVLTGCMSSNFNHYLRNDDIRGAEEWLKFLKSTYKHVYVELMRTNIDWADKLLPLQVKLAKKYELPVVATCDSHYLDQEDYIIQEIAWCISDGRKLSDPERRKYESTEFFVKTKEEMSELFKDYPEAVSNTIKISELVDNYSIEFVRVQPKYKVGSTEIEMKELLRKHVEKKTSRRYKKITKEISDRVDYELDIINTKGYNDYFLVVEDYIQWARDQGILVGPGRGSGAGSVVAYILGITDLDPFRWKLIFERFLNPERMSPPDFDVDFQDDRRDELFTYMEKRYGKENTSFIGTFGRLKTKAAIRDVARVMGIDLSTADRLSKMVKMKFGKVYSMNKMRAEFPEFDDIIKESPDLELMAKYVIKLENVARHISKHACGFLVTPSPVTDYVPIQVETKSENTLMTQYEGMHLEPIGLMKFDFLGLTNLTIISKVIKLIKELHNIKLEIENIPLDDEATFKIFQMGKTDGIFQFESDGMKKYLRDLVPNEMEDLIFLNAAYRPGAMNYISSYISRKKGEEKVDYLDPCLEDVLKPTYGFAIYQEQVINIAVEFAGYSLGEADMLRRAMGKKKKEVMIKEKERFMKKAIKKGHTEEKATQIFSYLEPFADYGFNRSHSACYSIIAYQTAYLKAHYPVEFVASLMEVDCKTPDKLTKDLKSSQEMKIKLLPPSVNESMVHFTIDKEDSIRFGLSGIKGVGMKVMENIVEKRKKIKFTSLEHMLNVIGTENLTKKDLECLIKVGAMDEFGYRSQLLEVMPLVFDNMVKYKKNFEGGQSDLFAVASTNTFENQNHDNFPKIPMPTTKQEKNIERLNWEKELLGIFLSTHPLVEFDYLIAAGQVSTLADVLKLEEGQKYEVVVMMSRIKIIYTKKDGKAMAFVSVEDQYDKAEAVIFPRGFEKTRNLIKELTPLIIKGSVNIREGEKSLIIDEILDLDQVKLKNDLSISICDEHRKSKLAQLKELLNKNPGNNILKIFYGEKNTGKFIVKKVALSEELNNFIKPYRC